MSHNFEVNFDSDGRQLGQIEAQGRNWSPFDAGNARSPGVLINTKDGVIRLLKIPHSPRTLSRVNRAGHGARVGRIGRDVGPHVDTLASSRLAIWNKNSQKVSNTHKEGRDTIKTAHRNEISKNKARWAAMCTWRVTGRPARHRIIFAEQGGTQQTGMSSRIGKRHTDFGEVSPSE